MKFEHYRWAVVGLSAVLLVASYLMSLRKTEIRALKSRLEAIEPCAECVKRECTCLCVDQELEISRWKEIAKNCVDKKVNLVVQ